jgi:hypothetical protein
MGFAGGAVWTSQTTGICIWYLPLVRGMEMADLFSDPAKPGRETAYLIWVSDFEANIIDPGKPGEAFTRALIPAGMGTIYFSDKPETRVWSDLTNRSSWGTVVAKFVRHTALLQSPDAFASDSFIFSAEMLWSTSFFVNGKLLSLGRVMPHGMTCFESGLKGSSSEAGTCIAIGFPVWF